jgi:ThiF family
MNTTSEPGIGPGDGRLPLKLVLARGALDACIVSAWGRGDERPAASSSGRLWHAAMTLAAAPTGCESGVLTALAAPLTEGPPVRPAWRSPRSASGHVGRSLAERAAPLAFVLIFLAESGESPPADRNADCGGDWDRWVASCAPEHRLATPSMEPDLLVLWMRVDGLCRAVFRPGEQWRRACARMSGPAAERTLRWHEIAALDLPGAEMLKLRWTAAASPTRVQSMPDAYGEPDLGEPGGAEDRYSRLSPALGPDVMRRLQACTIAVVGCGRAGSAMAHTLCRVGCSLLVLDPDTMSMHSLDGDLPALMEGQPKVRALRRQLQGLMRPGATLDVRILGVASPAAGALLAQADIIVCAADNDAAAAWADAWGLATHKPRLFVASGLHPHGAEADLRLLVPGGGCLCCTGGFSQQAVLAAQIRAGVAVPAPAAGERQRVGSLRSWGMVATHMGLRLLEHMVAGRIRTSLFRHLAEQDDGGLTVRDWRPMRASGQACPMCRRLEGAGIQAVREDVLLAALEAAGGVTASATGRFLSPPRDP